MSKFLSYLLHIWIFVIDYEIIQILRFWAVNTDRHSPWSGKNNKFMQNSSVPGLNRSCYYFIKNQFFSVPPSERPKMTSIVHAFIFVMLKNRNICLANILSKLTFCCHTALTELMTLQNKQVVNAYLNIPGKRSPAFREQLSTERLLFPLSVAFVLL